MSKKPDPNKAAIRAQKEQMKRLDALELPELEEYLLQSPELVGLLEAEEIAPSEFENIKEDAGLRQNQLDALDMLRQRADEGLTASDKYEMEQLLGDVAANQKAAQKQIESNMAQRGMDSSGAALLAQQANKQAGANQAREKAMQMAAQAQQNKMAALSQLGQQSGQMSQQDYARQAQAASAKDIIARANAMNRQNVNAQNLSAQQQIANQQANISNQQAQVGNQIAQQNFNNQLSKASGQGSVANNLSSINANAPQKPGLFQSALGGAATGASVAGPAGAGMGAAIGAGVGALGSMFEDGGIVRAEDGNLFNFDAMSKDLAKAGQGQQVPGMAVMGRTTDVTPEEVQTYEQAKEVMPKEESKFDIQKGLAALSKMTGSGTPEKRQKLSLQDFSMNKPENALQMVAPTQFANPFRAEDGGIPCRAEDGSLLLEEGVIDSGMDMYAGDRVDAKVNDGEAVINIPQQQRLMDFIRGKISPEEMGSEDIVEGVPRDFRNDMHDKLEGESPKSNKMQGLEKLLEMLGKE